MDDQNLNKLVKLFQPLHTFFTPITFDLSLDSSYPLSIRKIPIPDQYLISTTKLYRKTSFAQRFSVQSARAAVSVDYEIVAPLHVTQFPTLATNSKNAYEFQAISLESNKIRAVCAVPFYDDDLVSELLRRFHGMERHHHRHLPRVFHAHVHSNHIVLAWEFCPNGSLITRTHLTTDGIHETQAIRILQQMLSAISHLHAKGHWHGDVRPKNVLFSANGEVKLHGIRTKLSDDQLSNEANLFGIPKQAEFAAPEFVILKDKRVGPNDFMKGDIWSAGLCLYIMMSRDLNFSNSKLFDVAHDNGKIFVKNECLLRHKRVQMVNKSIRKLLSDMLCVLPRHRITARDALIRCTNLLSNDLMNK